MMGTSTHGPNDLCLTQLVSNNTNWVDRPCVLLLCRALLRGVGE
jgi:hypothetical protein